MRLKAREEETDTKSRKKRVSIAHLEIVEHAFDSRNCRTCHKNDLSLSEAEARSPKTVKLKQKHSDLTSIRPHRGKIKIKQSCGISISMRCITLQNSL